MPNEAETEVQRLRRELTNCRQDAAKIIYALDRAAQLIEMLMVRMPADVAQSVEIKTCKEGLFEAMRQIKL